MTWQLPALFGGKKKKTPIEEELKKKIVST